MGGSDFIFRFLCFLWWLRLASAVFDKRRVAKPIPAPAIPRSASRREGAWLKVRVMATAT